MMSYRLKSLVLPVVFLASHAAAQTGTTSLPTEPPAPSPVQASEPPQPPAPPPPAESTKLPAKPAATPGTVTSKWNATLYGFAEFDIMHDSTESFSDSPGNGLIVRSDGSTAFAGTHGRTQTTARNSRLGIRLAAPEWNSIKATGLIEGDFMGNQPAVTEGSFLNSATFRLRAATVKAETPYIDVLAGQTYFLFGQQPYFFPPSLWFFGLPNQVFGRTQQLRISHAFKSDPVNLEIAASAQRPPQRDSEIPDLQGALKITLNDWKGVHSIGSGSASLDGLTIGVSGSVRSFRVNEFTATPMNANTATGWGVSVDGMIPIIPASSATDKANALTATGSFVTGSGDGDLYGLTGGATFPSLPPPAGGGTAPAFNANIDNGIVQYDSNGVLRTLNWTTFMVGLQYYLPPHGEVLLAADYTQGDSDNITDGLTGSALGKVMKKSQFFEATLLADITPAIRAGFAWQHLEQTLGDGVKNTNERFELSAYYFF